MQGSKPGRDLGVSAPDRRKGKATGAEAAEDPVCTQDSKDTSETGQPES